MLIVFSSGNPDTRMGRWGASLFTGCGGGRVDRGGGFRGGLARMDEGDRGGIGGDSRGLARMEWGKDRGVSLRPAFTSCSILSVKPK